MGDKLVKKGLVVGIIFLFIAVDIPATGNINNVKTKLEEQQGVIEKTLIVNTNSDNIDWWPKYKHDLHNSGNTTATGPVTNNILWTFTAGYWIDSAPAVVDNRVYFGSDDEYFYCLNATNGSKIWSYFDWGGSSNAAPCVYDGKVYQTGAGYHFYCLDAYNGNLIWNFKYDWYGGSSPSVAYGNVYFSKASKIYCLDAEDGDMIWNYTITGNWWSDGEVINDGKVYIGSTNSVGPIYCFNAYNGSVIWTFNTNSSVSAEMVLFNGKLYCGGKNGLWCLNADNGTLIWHKNTGELYNGPAVAYGKLYFVSSGNGIIYCLDAETGNESWTLGPYGFQDGTTPATVSDGKVYLSVVTLGKLLCLDAYTGELIWEYYTGYPNNTLFTAPTIVNGTLYAGSFNLRKLYAFGGYEAPPITPKKPSGQTYIAINFEYVYSTNTTDPEEDKVQYRFDWDANGSHDYSNWSDLIPSGTNVYMMHAWNNSGTYIVKAQARDEHYALSNWSEGLAIEAVENNPPSEPSDPDPPDNAKNVDINADLSWNCSDPDGENLTFDVYFEAYDSSPDEIVSHNQSETWFDPGTMNYGRPYYWMIVAWDPLNQSSIGDVWHFTTGIQPNNAPYPPSNPHPENGSINIDREVILTWTGGDPDENDTVVYDVYLEANDPTPDVRVADDIANTSYNPGILDWATTYYWQIVAKDNHFASTPGPVWHFTTKENTPPDPPTINGPTNGKIGIDNNYTFQSADPDNDNIYYHICWGDKEIIYVYGPYPSGKAITLSYNWTRKGTYIIQCKAKDIYDSESNWTTLTVTISRSAIK